MKHLRLLFWNDKTVTYMFSTYEIQKQMLSDTTHASHALFLSLQAIKNTQMDRQISYQTWGKFCIF